MLLLLFVASHAIQPAPLSKWVLIFIIITSHWSVVVALVNALVECNWNKTGTKKYQENNDNSNHWWCAFLGWYGCHCLQSLKIYLHKQNQCEHYKSTNKLEKLRLSRFFFHSFSPTSASLALSLSLSRLLSIRFIYFYIYSVSLESNRQCWQIFALKQYTRLFQ